MGPVVERIRNEERQKEVQGLHNVYKAQRLLSYICYKRFPGLLFSSGRLLIHNILHFPIIT